MATRSHVYHLSQRSGLYPSIKSNIQLQLYDNAYQS